MSSVYTAQHYVGAILILFTFYIKLFTFAIQPGYHGASVCQYSVCSFYLFVIAFFVTLGVIPPHLRSHGNRKIKQKNNRNTSSFKKFYPNSLSLFNHESSNLTLFHSHSFPLWQEVAAYLYKFVLLIVIVGLCSISPGSRACSQLCADK